MREKQKAIWDAQVWVSELADGSAGKLIYNCISTFLRFTILLWFWGMDSGIKKLYTLFIITASQLTVLFNVLREKKAFPPWKPMF